MKKFYYYLTKHCFLTAFAGASIIWSVLSYNSFYERFDTIGYLHSTIFDTIHKVCSNEKNIENIQKEFDRIFEGLGGDVAVTVTNKQYGKIYESHNYKPAWYNEDTILSGVLRTSPKSEDSQQYEYEIKYQFKCLFPVALVRLWSFSIIPNLKYYFHISKSNNIESLLKPYVLQSIYFWIVVLVFYSFLSFYRKELNL